MRRSGTDVESLVAELRRASAAESGAGVVLAGERARRLAEELARLLQSGHRLRRQNGKLRRRIERLKAGLADEDETHGEAADDEADSEGGLGGGDE